MKPVPPGRRTKTDLLEEEIEAALQPGCFIKYGAGWSFVEGLDRVEDKIARLVRSAPARAVALYETFLAGSYEKAEELWLETREIDRLIERLRKARDGDLEGISHYATERVAKKLAKAHPGVVRAEHHRKTGFISGFEELVAGGGPGARPTFLECAKARWSTSPGN